MGCVGYVDYISYLLMYFGICLERYLSFNGPRCVLGNLMVRLLSSEIDVTIVDGSYPHSSDSTHRGVVNRAVLRQAVALAANVYEVLEVIFIQGSS